MRRERARGRGGGDREVGNDTANAAAQCYMKMSLCNADAVLAAERRIKARGVYMSEDGV